MNKFRTYTPAGNRHDFDDIHVGTLDTYQVYRMPYTKGDRNIDIVRAYCVRDALEIAREKHGEKVIVI